MTLMLREFARRVTTVDALKTAQRASLVKLDALFAPSSIAPSAENSDQ